MALNIDLVGVPEIEVDGRPFAVDTRKAVALLAYLAVEGHAQDREHLVDLLWPDYDSERGRATLRRTLSALKSALGDGWIEVDRTKVGLVKNGVELDVDRLTVGVAPHSHPEGESCEECVQALAAAVASHRGEFMQGFVLKDAPRFEDWQLAQNEKIRRETSGLFDKLIASALALGDYDTALDASQRRIALDPLNEAAHRAAMRVHSLRGDRTGVVTTYRALVATLERELGVEPLEETTDLYRALSRGASPAETATAPVVAQSTEQLPFVGRTREWERLLASYRPGTVIGISGEPGIGKTRLIEEFADHVRATGARVVIARSHEAESNIAYGVLTSALRDLLTSKVARDLSSDEVDELGRLLPELEASANDSPVASRFYDAVSAAIDAGLRGEGPGVLVFEDVHWADDATLEVLAYVARRIGETRACLVCTWRRDEARNPALLDRVVRDVPAVVIELDRLGAGDLRSLLQGSASFGDDSLENVLRKLIAETEGVPFFVNEYLKSFAENASWDVPSSVRDLVRRRLERVRGAAAQVLDTAAVIDRTVDFDMVTRVSGRSDLETADALDDLAAAGLMRAIQDDAGPRYEFSHEKLRTVAYESLSPARRHVLHRRAAEALIDRPAADGDGATAAAVAHHLELAGDRVRAAQFHFRAGSWAQRVFAHAQALDHFTKALALGDRSSEIHEAIADVHVLQGDYAEAITSYETAAALGPQPERIDRKLGALYLRRGEYDVSQAHLLDALERSSDRPEAAEILVDLSLAAHRRGADDEAARHAAAAIERADAWNDSVLRARAENAAGMLASARGDADVARSHLQVAFDMATIADDLPAMIAALNNLALVERRAGKTDEAIELTRQALEACKRFGDRHREAALENNLADLLHEKGDRDEAMEHLKRATAIFAVVGTDPHGPLPEVWKLVEW